MNPNPRTWVAVVIPCFNLGRYLNEAVNSVLAQTVVEVELVIVDDGSTDEQTMSVLETLKVLGLRVLRTENHGVSAARNAGIAASTSPWICCLDADDLIEPTYLQRAVAVFEQDRPGEVGIVTSSTTVFGESNETWPAPSFDPELLVLRNQLHAASVFRRECWDRVGGYRTDLTGYQDWDFWLAIVLAGWRWEKIDEALFLYRDRPGSMVKNSNQRRTSLYRLILERTNRLDADHWKKILVRNSLLLDEKEALFSALATARTYWEDRWKGAEAHAADLVRSKTYLEEQWKKAEAHAADLVRSKTYFEEQWKKAEAHAADLVRSKTYFEEQWKKAEAHAADLVRSKTYFEEQWKKAEAHAADLVRSKTYLEEQWKKAEAHAADLVRSKTYFEEQWKKAEAHAADLVRSKTYLEEQWKKAEAHAADLVRSKTYLEEQWKKAETYVTELLEAKRYLDGELGKKEAFVVELTAVVDHWRQQAAELDKKSVLQQEVVEDLRSQTEALNRRTVVLTLQRRWRRWWNKTPYRRQPRVVRHEPLAPAQPLVSVVIPCYNYGRFLREAVESAKIQTLGSVEVVVVDDGSTDPGTIDVLGGLEAEGGVRILRRPNQKQAAARNFGISQAAGRYVCCLDADDVLKPTYLETVVTAMVLGGHTVGYSWLEEFGEQTAVWFSGVFLVEELMTANQIPTTAVFTKEAWEVAGGLDTTMRFGYEDWEFWLRLASRGNTGVVVSEALFLYRKHGVSLMTDSQSNHNSLAAAIRNRNRHLFTVDGQALGEAIRGQNLDTRVTGAWPLLENLPRIRTPILFLLPHAGNGKFWKSRLDGDSGKGYSVVYLTDPPQWMEWAEAGRRSGVPSLTNVPFTDHWNPEQVLESGASRVVTLQHFLPVGEDENYIRCLVTRTSVEKVHLASTLASWMPRLKAWFPDLTVQLESVP